MLSISKLRSKTYACLIGATILTGSSFAAVVQSTPTGGLWSAGSTWNGGLPPGPGDDVIIFTGPGFGVSLDVNVTGANAINSLDIGGGFGFGALNIQNNQSLEVTNDLTVDGANVILDFLGPNSTLDINGNTSFLNTSLVDMTAGGELFCAGDLTLSGAAFLSGAGSIIMDGNVQQLITGSFFGPEAFNNLIIQNSFPTPNQVDAVIPNQPVEVLGQLAVNDGAFVSISTVSQNSTYQDVLISSMGTLLLSSSGGDIDILGNLTNSAGGNYVTQNQDTNFVGNSIQTVLGSYQFSALNVNNSGAPGSDEVSFTPDDVSVQVTGQTTITNGSLSTKDSFVFSNNVTIGAGSNLTQKASGINIFVGNLTNNGTFTALSGSSSQFSGSNNTLITGVTPFTGANQFNSLIISKSNNTRSVTTTQPVLANTLAVNNGNFIPAANSTFGNTTINSTSASNFGTMNPPMTATINYIGNLTRNNLGRFRANSGTARMAKSTAGVQEITGGFTGANAFYNLEIDHTGSSNEVRIPFNEIEITNLLDLVAGELTTFGFVGVPGLEPPDIYINVPGPDSPGVGVQVASVVNGPRGNGGFINGAVRRAFNNSLGNRLFPVGTNGQYTPISMAVTSANTAGSGDIRVAAVDGEHPPYATAGGGPNDPLLAHDRHWFIENFGTANMAWALTMGYDDAENTTVEANQVVSIYNPPIKSASQKQLPMNGDSYETFSTAIDTGTNNAIGSSVSRFGAFTLLEDDDPIVLAVELADFYAYSEGPGNPVNIVWETASEIDTAGFNLYRITPEKAATSADNIKLNDALIIAEGNETFGSTYTLLDSEPINKGELRGYLLEEIEFDGTVNTYGPVFTSIRKDSAPGNLKDTSVENWTIYN